MSVALAGPMVDGTVHRDRFRTLVLVSVLTCLATAIAAIIAATGTSGEPASVALGRAP